MEEWAEISSATVFSCCTAIFSAEVFSAEVSTLRFFSGAKVSGSLRSSRCLAEPVAPEPTNSILSDFFEADGVPEDSNPLVA